LPRSIVQIEPDNFRPRYNRTVGETVAKDGGTPVIPDDTWGDTDPERLKLMGAVLAIAAKGARTPKPKGVTH